MQQRNEIVLGAYLSYGVGHHAGAWRHPSVPSDGAQNIHHYFSLAKRAEEGFFDFIFLSDTPSVFNDDTQGYGGRVVVFEPLTLLSALAGRTENIGLIATSSTTYKEPYNLAREFLSLDHISGGRAGWNMVTSSKSDAAYNFGNSAHPAHDARYERAEEFYDVVTGLWDSWEEGALPRHKASGVFYDPTKRHSLDHQGANFSVRGPLNLARSPQGRPLVVQAGSSERGVGLAARTAELVFTAQSDINRAQVFYADLKRRAHAAGRHPNDVLIMPGLSIYSGSTAEEGHLLLEQLNELVHPCLGLSMLGDLLGGVDLSGVELDGRLPSIPESNGNTSRRALIEDLAWKQNLSVRQLYQHLAVARGHLALVGSHKQIAETMAHWFHEGACDGFNVMPPLLPGSLDAFVDHVVPELQRMGIYKSNYLEGTLREKLGISSPINKYSAQ